MKPKWRRMEKRQSQPKTYSDGRGGVYTVHLSQDDVGNINTRTKPLAFKKAKMETVEIDLDEVVFTNLSLRAHELQMTLNDYINQLLRDLMKEEIEHEENHKMLFDLE